MYAYNKKAELTGEVTMKVPQHVFCIYRQQIVITNLSSLLSHINYDMCASKYEKCYTCIVPTNIFYLVCMACAIYLFWNSKQTYEIFYHQIWENVHSSN